MSRFAFLHSWHVRSLRFCLSFVRFPGLRVSESSRWSGSCKFTLAPPTSSVPSLDRGNAAGSMLGCCANGGVKGLAGLCCWVRAGVAGTTLAVSEAESTIAEERGAVRSEGETLLEEVRA